MTTPAEQNLVTNSEQPSDQGASTNFSSWLVPLLRNWRMVAGFPILGGVLAVLVTLALPKKFTTTVSFVPVQSDAAAGALSGLAGQIGIALPTADMTATPDFYAKLLRTDPLLLNVIRANYTAAKGDEVLTGSIIDFYEISESDSGRTFDKALEVFKKKVLSISFDRQTSVVTVRIRTKWRDLSLQVAERIVAEVDSFNLQSRQGRASAEVRFLQLRLDTAATELRAAENALSQFLTTNRTYQSDPVLVAEYGRRERQLQLRQGVYTTLVQSSEAARLAAVRNTPSIDLIERPSPALRFDRRRTLTKAIIGAGLGFIVAVLIVSASTAAARLRIDDPASAAALTNAVRDIKVDLLGAVSRVQHKGDDNPD